MSSSDTEVILNTHKQLFLYSTFRAFLTASNLQYVKHHRYLASQSQLVITLLAHTWKTRETGLKYLRHFSRQIQTLFTSYFYSSSKREKETNFDPVGAYMKIKAVFRKDQDIFINIRNSKVIQCWGISDFRRNIFT
jgi:hypothetical protein